MNKYLEIKLDKKIWVLNYLKGFSIFTIALMHLLPMMNAMPSKILTLSLIGGTGVHVFFLCSGVGLYLSYLNKKTSYKEFIKKRLSKIYIPYIIIVAVSYVLPWMYIGDDRGSAFLSHVFLFKMFVPRYEESFGTQFWFVSTILQLYVLFIPICMLKEKIKNSKIFISLFCMISVAWWVFCYIAEIGHIRIWGSFCLQYIWEFALGIILAEYIYYRKYIRINNYLMLAVSIIGIGLQGALALGSEALKVFNDVPGLFGYTSLALLVSQLPFMKSVFIKVSNFSYEYFLVHILVFKTIFICIKPQGLIIQIACGGISIALALMLAYGYNKIISLFVTSRSMSYKGKK